jgi:hypothetical protein
MSPRYEGKPTAPKKSGGNWLKRAAKKGAEVVVRGAATAIKHSRTGRILDVASRLTGKTVGGCVGGGAVGGGSVTAGACYVATPSGQSGFTATAGRGIGLSFGANGLIGPTFSNARTLDDLSKGFRYADVTVGRGGPYSGGAQVVWGRNAAGKPIWEATVGWAPSIPGPLPISAAYGESYTWTAQSY